MEGYKEKEREGEKNNDKQESSKRDIIYNEKKL